MLPNLKYLDDADADLNEAEDSEGIFITISCGDTYWRISVFAFSDDDDEAAENGEGGESESGGEIQRDCTHFVLTLPLNNVSVRAPSFSF